MQHIPLNLLVLSKNNVRKVKSEAGLDELEASILTYGLQQNLVVIPVKDSNKFEIIAGERRFAVLKRLQKKGVYTKDYPVACTIADTENATGISLAENMVRLNMHPADQYEAFAKLADQNKTVGDIAASFGISEGLVQKRLKLGRVSPQLIEAFREEKFSIEALMAFTLSDDHQKQEETYNLFKDSDGAVRAYDIRNALTVTTLPSSHKLVRYIGLEAYEKAGGTYKKDLFSRNEEECYVENVALVHTLAEDNLRLAAPPTLGEWKWMEVRLDFSHEERAAYKQLYPHKLGDVPEELTKRYEELECHISDMEANGENPDENEEIQQQIAAINSEMDSYHGFSAEERAIAGCIITVDYDGELRIYEGLVHPDDQKALKAVSTKENPEKAKQTYSQPLTDSLKYSRLQILKQHIAKDYETAFDAALYVMCIDYFKPYRHRNDWLKVRAEKYSAPVKVRLEGEGEQQEAQLAEGLSLDWLNITEETECFKAFCKLDISQKQQLFAFCVAQSFTPQLTTESHHSPLFEMIYQRLGIATENHWRPTQQNFLGRIPKKQLLAIGEEIFGNRWVVNNQEKKKDVIVTKLDDAFANTFNEKFTVEQHSKLTTWLPEGMACSAEVKGS
jgi:ParB family transcriptional regulator, chromosome partitioning protein